MKTQKTHRVDGCGRANVVDSFDDVTCLDWRPDLAPERKYGSPDDRGLGRLRCNCGRPYSEHSIGWCPNA